MHRNVLVALALSTLAGSAGAQLVVGNDQTNPTIYYRDLAAGTWSPLLTGTAATVWGMAFDGGSNTLYWNNGSTFRSAAFSTGGLTPSAAIPITIGGASASLTGFAFSGGQLIGYRSVTAPGFYSVNPTTGVASLLAATPASTDFGAFDFDPATGDFYVGNDGTGLSGRGIYRVSGILSGTPSYSFLAAYPGGDTDVDGLAVGGGRVYLINDGSGTTFTRDFYVFNLATNTFESNITTPFTGTNGVFSGGAFIPSPGAASVLGLAGLLAARRRR